MNLSRPNTRSNTDQLEWRSSWACFQWPSGWGCFSQPTAWSGAPEQHCWHGTHWWFFPEARPTGRSPGRRRRSDCCCCPNRLSRWTESRPPRRRRGRCWHLQGREDGTRRWRREGETLISSDRLLLATCSSLFDL